MKYIAALLTLFAFVQIEATHLLYQAREEDRQLSQIVPIFTALTGLAIVAPIITETSTSAYVITAASMCTVTLVLRLYQIINRRILQDEIARINAMQNATPNNMRKRIPIAIPSSPVVMV